MRRQGEALLAIWYGILTTMMIGWMVADAFDFRKLALINGFIVVTMFAILLGLHIYVLCKKEDPEGRR